MGFFTRPLFRIAPKRRRFRYEDMPPDHKAVLLEYCRLLPDPYAPPYSGPEYDRAQEARRELPQVFVDAELSLEEKRAEAETIVAPWRSRAMRKVAASG